MSEYMPDNNNYTGFNTPMPSQDADEIKSLLKKGNVIRAITLGSVILLGGALIAMQLKNGKEISDISNDVHKTSAELSDVSNMLDNISDNVYDIMEQGCSANNNVNNNNNNSTSPEPYEWEPYTEKPAIYIYAADSFTETQVNLSLYRTDMVSTWPMPDSVDAYTYTWNVGATNDGKLYDKDGNGWIDENDEVYEQLRIWIRNEDGTDSLLSLKEADVGAIYLGSAETRYTHMGSDLMARAMTRASGIFLKESGGVGTVAQVDLAAI